MKRSTLLFIAFCALPIMLSFSGIRPKKSLFNGVWQFTNDSYNGAQTTGSQILIKVFDDGKFDGYLIRPQGSAKTMSGTYKILNDSIYTETLIKAPNEMMVGKTYVIKYKLKGNAMIAIGFYDVPNDGVALKVNYNQTWTRIDYQDWDKQYHSN